MGRFSLLGLALLASCATVAPAAEVVAPMPRTYTCEQIHKAAAEHLALPPDSMLAVLVDDYRLERKQLRALHGLPDPAPCPKAPP